MLNSYLPQKINSGRWITAYTLFALRDLPKQTEFILPIASLGTPYSAYEELGEFLLPPLFHEALDPSIKQPIIDRIHRCFPDYAHPQTNTARLRIVELPVVTPAKANSPDVLAFSVDTAVEEHGPHLPLGTDTVQSYGALAALKEKLGAQFTIGHPLEYGQLTWGLPFGFSVDLTAELLTKYVSGYASAMQNWLQPKSMYVVDVHGSIVHRKAIVAGLEQSHVDQWSFRWLHEPLAEFSSKRNDQHAGGVETALVEFLNPELTDPVWWPGRFEEIEARQLSLAKAVELTPDLDLFIAEAARLDWNGIVGGIENYPSLDAADLFARIMAMAQEDVQQLLAGNPSRNAGLDLW
jgi:creatinine amidohydrolase/Fe(II)-dependent formamide hydrolase-like protein